MESTEIARASRQDNWSLRMIQIMSMVFLPCSLISSIFGMGFFSTDLSDDGNVTFLVSGNWWIYLAVTVPLSTSAMVLMGFFSGKEKKKPWSLPRALGRDSYRHSSVASPSRAKHGESLNGMEKMA